MQTNINNFKTNHPLHSRIPFKNKIKKSKNKFKKLKKSILKLINKTKNNNK